jgi:hypothetical protein
VIGVHTPEFGVEHDLANVKRAIREMRIDYPVAVDSDYKVWDAFANRYWPATYFVDADDSIRGRRFGEGRYEECELMIRELLAEAGRGRHRRARLGRRDRSGGAGRLELARRRHTSGTAAGSASALPVGSPTTVHVRTRAPTNSGRIIGRSPEIGRSFGSRPGRTSPAGRSPSASTLATSIS